MMERDLVLLVHYGRCLSVRKQQNLHILTCLFKGFKSVKCPVKEWIHKCHTKHIVLLLTSNNRIIHNSFLRTLLHMDLHQMSNDHTWLMTGTF